MHERGFPLMFNIMVAVATGEHKKRQCLNAVVRCEMCRPHTAILKRRCCRPGQVRCVVRRVCHPADGVQTQLQVLIRHCCRVLQCMTHACAHVVNTLNLEADNRLLIHVASVL